MLSLKDLTPVTFDDISEIRSHFRRFPPEHSDYLPGTMIPWGHYMRYSKAWVNGSLLIMTEHEGRRLLRPPVGTEDPDLLSDVVALSRELKLDLSLSMVGARTFGWAAEARPELEFIPHRDYFEYVYLSSVLSELPGKRFLNMRNYLNKFRRENDHTVERMETGNMSEVKDFLLRWCQRKGCNEEAFLLQEREANHFALEHMDELGLEGLLIRVQGRVEAFSMFEHMTDDMAVIHYEKADQDITGIYQAINNETARHLRDRYTYLNRESDMGIEGLRSVKERYGPDHLLEVFDALL
jgi:hypothetical protein